MEEAINKKKRIIVANLVATIGREAMAPGKQPRAIGKEATKRSQVAISIAIKFVRIRTISREFARIRKNSHEF